MISISPFILETGYDETETIFVLFFWKILTNWSNILKHFYEVSEWQSTSKQMSLVMSDLEQDLLDKSRSEYCQFSSDESCTSYQFWIFYWSPIVWIISRHRNWGQYLWGSCLTEGTFQFFFSITLYNLSRLTTNNVDLNEKSFRAIYVLKQSF